jgi:hypothetical protein
MASVAELKEKHAAATASVNSLRERLRQRREMLLDTDGEAAALFLLLLLLLIVRNPLASLGEFRGHSLIGVSVRDCAVQWRGTPRRRGGRR